MLGGRGDVATTTEAELPAVVDSAKTKKKKQECKRSLDRPVDLDPLTAATRVQTLLKLSEAEKEKFLSELLQTSGHPILALKINQAWVAHYGAGAETAVLDEIAEFDVPKGERRDEQNPGFLYHFKTGYELDKCRASLLQNHQTAFALSPETLALMGPASAAFIAPEDREPLAFTAVIRKVVLCQDDIEPCQFFHDVAAFQFFYT